MSVKGATGSETTMACCIRVVCIEFTTCKSTITWALTQYKHGTFILNQPSVYNHNKAEQHKHISMDCTNPSIWYIWHLSISWELLIAGILKYYYTDTFLFLNEWYFPSVCLSVRLSVRLSHLRFLWVNSWILLFMFSLGPSLTLLSA